LTDIVYVLFLVTFAPLRRRVIVENKKRGKLMMKYAMNYGLILGAFWVFKYMFFITGISLRGTNDYLADTFIYLCLYLLPVITLTLSYVLVKRFRDNVFGGTINYIQCILFGIQLFFCAALIEAVIIYIHYKFIAEPQYLVTRDKSWLEMVLQSLFSREWLDAQKETYGTIIILISEIVKNVLIGFFLSSVYGIFVTRKKKEETPDE